jgi:RNA polymerase sigma-70 factor (ECF subfamily)
MQRELVELARAGDTEAFRDLVVAVSGRLYGIAFRILRDADQADDALQRALIQAWEGLPGLRDPDRFDAWTYQLVVHASFREARRRGRWNALVREIHVEPAAADDRVAEVLDRDEVERGFRRLTPEHRAVLVLRYYAGLPVDEIAEILGIPPGTAASRLHYAAQSFRAAFEADARQGVAWRTPA